MSEIPAAASPPESLADLPPEVLDYLRAVYERARTAIEAVVAESGRTPVLAERLAVVRLAVLEAETAPVYPSMAAAGTPVACAKGCGCCCSLTVEVSADEAFALAGALAQDLAPAALAGVKARAAANAAATRGLGALERHRRRLFCPVLDPETQACLGHRARPTACQGYLSLDLGRCQADHLDPSSQPVPQPEAAALLRDIVSGVRREALREAGLVPGRYELTAALDLIWTRPGLEQAWLAGEPALELAAFRD